MKILAIGDIHTKQWIIESVEKIAHKYDAVVFCGDYADNWNTPAIESIKTWYRMKKLCDENENVHAVIGNHDYAYLHSEISGRSSGWDPITQHLINIPENKELKDWLLTLPAVFKLDGVTFSHAGVTNEWDGNETVWGLWQDTSPIWARPRDFGGYITYKEIPQVIGHNTYETCKELAPNVWCIDTFSEHSDNTPVGDFTVLEVTDGKDFKVVQL